MGFIQRKQIETIGTGITKKGKKIIIKQQQTKEKKRKEKKAWHTKCHEMIFFSRKLFPIFRLKYGKNNQPRSKVDGVRKINNTRK